MPDVFRFATVCFRRSNHCCTTLQLLNQAVLLFWVDYVIVPGSLSEIPCLLSLIQEFTKEKRSEDGQHLNTQYDLQQQCEYVKAFSTKRWYVMTMASCHHRDCLQAGYILFPFHSWNSLFQQRVSIFIVFMDVFWQMCILFRVSFKVKDCTKRSSTMMWRWSHKFRCSQ